MLKTVGFPSTRTGDQTIVNGNLVIGTAGKGIDFSADPSAAGMTSELLDDYEEGTWTPNQGGGLTVVGAFSSNGTYTKVGRLVTVTGAVIGATSIACSTGNAICTNLPLTASKGFSGALSVSNANQSSTVLVFTTTCVCNSAIAGTSSSITFTVTYEV